MSQNTAPTSYPTSSKSTGVAWLNAVGPDKKVQRWVLPEKALLVGRPEAQEPPDKLTVVGDNMLSRRHFWAERKSEGLTVKRCSEARNPIFFQGQEHDEFQLSPGQHFVVGGTDFQFVVQDTSEPPTPMREFTLHVGSRNEAQDRHARECLRALLELLPSLLHATDEAGLWSSALNVLASVLPRAGAVMAVKVELERLKSDEGDFCTVLHSYQPSAAAKPLAPSRRLLRNAFQDQGAHVNLWEGAGGSGEGLTVQSQITWALAAPIPYFQDGHYALYAWGGETGQTLTSGGTEDQVGRQESVIIQIVADTLANQLRLRRMHRLEGQVGQFFSPALRKALLEQGSSDILQPARRHVTVLFFDLRGFSKATEQAEGDAIEQILKHHDALTEVMSTVTGCVFEEDGIVVDYQGDAMLACWGAPIACEDHADRAIRTARRILEKVYALELPFGTPVPGRKILMRCGMGIGSGEVVAGQIGAKHQIKFGVMGRVVNQASRLEGLTKYIGAPVLITSEVRARLADVLCRRVGRIRPAGMAEGVEVHELVVPVEHGGTGLTAEQVSAYEEGQQLFSQGKFMECLGSLRQVPLEDPVGSFLTRRAYQLMEEGPPANWDGVLEFKSK